MDKYRDPDDLERSLGADLIGHRVEIYWDGDNVYYPGHVTSFSQETRLHGVVYDADDGDEEYEEDLFKDRWRLWAGNEDDYLEFNKEKERQRRQEEAKIARSIGKKTYQSMVVDAIVALDERGGSSLKAIRRYIIANFLSGPKQTVQPASFNNLTLKAVMKSVATGEIERVRRSTFRLSFSEKDKRKRKLGQESDANDKGRGGEDGWAGTAAESNRALRKELHDARERRDQYLQERISLLLPFLPDKHYFWRRARKLEGVGVAASPQAETKRHNPPIPLSSLSSLALEQEECSGTERKAVEGMGDAPSSPLEDQPHPHSGPRPHIEGHVHVEVRDNGFLGNGHAECKEDLEEGVVAGEDSGGGAGEVSSAPAGVLESAFSEAEVHCEGSVGDEELVEEGGDFEGAVNERAGGVEEGKDGDEAEEEVEQSEQEAQLQQLESAEEQLAIEEMLGKGAISPGAPLVTNDDHGANGTAPGDFGLATVGEEAALMLLNEASVSVSSGAALDGVPVLVPPAQLTATLHPHQVLGISWMVHMFQHGMPMILGDQMGLGKTIQAIGFMAYLQFELRRPGPFLVVVPLSVLSNWISEVERFCPSLRATRFHGPKEERARLKAEELGSLSDFDIVVTTYEMLVSESLFFKRKYVWTAVIVDEGHRLKNDRSQLAEKIRAIPALSRVILTGTPLQNNLKELWALLHFLAPEIFTAASAEKFEFGFDLQKGRIDPNVLRQARKLLTVFMFRRIKEEVAVELPPRREFTLMVHLTPIQVSWYKQLLSGLDSATVDAVMRATDAQSQSTDTLPSPSNHSSAPTVSLEVAPSAQYDDAGATEEEPAMETEAEPINDGEWRKLMNLLLQLRKLCNHVFLMPGAAALPNDPDYEQRLVQGSGKLRLLDRVLPRLKEDGHRVLIFSQFTSTLDLLDDYCELKGIHYCRLDGCTNRVQRRLDLRRFNTPGSPLFVFLISTRAGGLGLNLASADTVILFDSDWNPQVDLQAMERAHRIGQTKPVTVYRLVSRGSVEERMLARAGKKLYLNAMVGESHGNDQEQIGTPSVSGLGAGLSKGELASLIRYGANAVVEPEDGKEEHEELTDAELDRLLGRGGPSDDKAEGMSVEEIQAKQAERLLARLSPLAELDLRQFQDVTYSKRKTTSDPAAEDLSALTLDTKRSRRERVVMVDGKGSGYGGDIPVLAETLPGDSVAVPSSSISLKRQREWTHLNFCALCGRRDRIVELSQQSKKRSRTRRKEAHGGKQSESLCGCNYCPLAFHTACMDGVGMDRSKKGFCCPHHRCSSCQRSTAAAGGLLFRCTGCLVGYCEDCLPTEEVEGEGRNQLLEKYGYHSRQAYYIRCTACKDRDECAKAVEMGASSSIDGRETGEDNGAGEDLEEGDGEGEDERSEGDQILLPAQQMQLQPVNLQEAEERTRRELEERRSEKARAEADERALLKRKSNQSSGDEECGDGEEGSEFPKKAKRKGSSLSTSDFGQEWENDPELTSCRKDIASYEGKTLPDTVSLATAAAWVREHPLCTLLLTKGTENDGDRRLSGAFDSVLSRVERGRYRAVSKFIEDVRASFSKRGNAAEILLTFFDQNIAPKLVLE